MVKTKTRKFLILIIKNVSKNNQESKDMNDEFQKEFKPSIILERIQLLT